MVVSQSTPASTMLGTNLQESCEHLLRTGLRRRALYWSRRAGLRASDADDICQEALLRLVRREMDKDNSIDIINLDRWVSGVMKIVARQIASKRHSQAQCLAAVNQVVAIEPSPDYRFPTLDVFRLMLSLPQYSAQLLAYSVYDGVSLKDMATLFRTSDAQVRKNWRRCKKLALLFL